MLIDVCRLNKRQKENNTKYLPTDITVVLITLCKILIYYNINVYIYE